MLDNWQVLHICHLDVTQDPPLWICSDCSYKRESTGKLVEGGDPHAVHMGTQGGIQGIRFDNVEVTKCPK